MVLLRKHIGLIILGCLFSLASSVTFAQQQRFEFNRISIDQGLSQSTVYCITQDSLGFMWFGTEDGLNRYDGFEFKTFLNNPHDSTTISNNRIMALFEDSNRNLWVGTLGGGLNFYNKKDETFTAFKNIPGNSKSLSSDIVMSVAQDPHGNIWVGTAGGGLNILDAKSKTFTQFKRDVNDRKSLPGNLVRSIHQSSNGTMLVGTDKGLCFFNEDSGTFTHVADYIGSTDRDLFKLVVSITESKKGDLWLSVEDLGIIVLNQNEKSVIKYTDSEESPFQVLSRSVLSIVEDENENFWVATYNGLQLFNPETSLSVSYQNNPFDPHSISCNTLRYLYESQSGIMWIGTYHDGVNWFNRKYNKFLTFHNSSNSTDFLPNSPVRSMVETTDGRLLVGTYGHGLFEINPTDEFSLAKRVNFSGSEELTSNFITSLIKDNNGNYWVGTDANGIFVLNSNKRFLAHYKHIPQVSSSLSSNRIRTLFFDSNNTLWVGTSGDGLCRYNNDGSFTAFKPNPDDPSNSISQDRILCFYEDSEKNMWIGTSSEGLNLFNRNTGEAIHYKNSQNDSSTISSNRILSILQDSKGRLWIGTGGGGINLFDYSSRTFTSFSTTDGLPNDVIYGILEDCLGNLWLSTNSGLCRFTYNSKNDYLFRTYKKTDGLQSNEFSESAYLNINSCKLAFGGINGLSIVNPEQLLDNDFIPSVAIRKINYFSKFREEGKTQSINVLYLTKKELSIPYSLNNVTFHFIALHFQNPKLNKYLYKLEGFDRNWVSPEQGQRFVTYTNLAKGKYMFRVKAANSDGVWNEVGDSMLLIVKPPYWQTWWFILSGIILVLLILFIVIRLRESNLLRMKKMLEYKVKVRTNEIMHQKEEIESQRDYLTQLNSELQQKNEEITAQKEELERTQKHLVQSEKMASIGLLTAGIAHEINNPINFVYGGVNSITRDFQDVDQVLKEILDIEKATSNPQETIQRIIELKEKHEFDEAYGAIIQTIQDIKFGAERTAEIVEGLRNFSRTESEEWVEADLHKIIDGILVLLKNKYKNSIEIVKSYDIDLSLIECKRGKINQVIMNLLSNAIDAIVDTGTITISTHLKENNCIFTIKDTGKGMSEEVQSRIFDPFFTTKVVGKGMGLGLSITYGIIQEHSGTINVNSKVGIGTEFVVTIPIKQT